MKRPRNQPERKRVEYLSRQGMLIHGLAGDILTSGPGMAWHMTGLLRRIIRSVVVAWLAVLRSISLGAQTRRKAKQSVHSSQSDIACIHESVRMSWARKGKGTRYSYAVRHDECRQQGRGRRRSLQEIGPTSWSGGEGGERGVADSRVGFSDAALISERARIERQERKEGDPPLLCSAPTRCPRLSQTTMSSTSASMTSLCSTMAGSCIP